MNARVASMRTSRFARSIAFIGMSCLVWGDGAGAQTPPSTAPFSICPTRRSCAARTACCAVRCLRAGQVTSTGRARSNVINGDYMPPTCASAGATRSGPGGQQHRCGRGEHRGPSRPTSTITAWTWRPSAARRQRLHPDQAGAGASLRRIRPGQSPTRPALVPRPRPHLRRRPDRLRHVGDADRGRVHLRAVSRAVRPAPAGNGAQGFHLPRLRRWRRAGEVAERLCQSADPRPAGRVADLAAGQSGRGRLFRHATGRPLSFG